MINNNQSTLLLYCCEDVRSHRPGGDTVPLSEDPSLGNHYYLPDEAPSLESSNHVFIVSCIVENPIFS